MKIKKLFTEIFLIEKKFKKNQSYFYLKTPNIAVIIAKIKDKFVVVSQNRIPINKITYEFPGGIIDKGNSALKTAKVELYEETGFRCIKNPKKLLSIYAEPGRINSKHFFFITDKIIKIKKPEKGIKLHLLSKSQIYKLIKKGEFNHSAHAYAFLSYLNMK